MVRRRHPVGKRDAALRAWAATLGAGDPSSLLDATARQVVQRERGPDQQRSRVSNVCPGHRAA